MSEAQGRSRELGIIYRPVAGLSPYDRNARTHSRKQIHQIAASIRQFGFTNPVLIDGNGCIIAGHGRVQAAKQIGMDRVPTVLLEHLTEAELRAYRLADNRLAEKAGWDPEILKIELQGLAELELDFDLELTGFETAEIDLILDGQPAVKDDPADAVPEAPDAAAAVTRAGDLWELGPHRLLCGDSRDVEAYRRLMEGDLARVVFSDPPYNVPVGGHVCGLARVQHREFAMASGEMSRAEFVAFLTAVFRNAAAASVDGAIHFQCMDWRHAGEMLEAGGAAYTELKNMCVWAKDNGGMGSLYRSQHELVFVWKSGTAPHVNTVELGRHGRYRTNLWSYAGVNTLKRDRMAELAMHSTVKPVALISDAIKDVSRRGDVVLDPFGGSGSTLIAAQRTGRRARLIEIDSVYCDVIVRRWATLTGGEAVLMGSGRRFGEIAAERLAAAEQPAAEVA
ncbi:site-specific DNA-methyltransferase [Falsiroseomonas sp.]|uniref:site-specific DNA-methyltransferase n=1 Tax=Falsiroseomonas sp. TaxID=2870721 RepID=UPI003565641C